MWATLALSTVLTWAPAQPGELTVENIRPRDWALGPARKNPNKVVPGDLYYLSFDVVGLQAKDNGEVSYTLSMTLTDKDGNKQFEQDAIEFSGNVTLGGARLPITSMARIGLDNQPGEITLTVTITDLLSKKKGKAVQKLTVLPKELGIVRIGLTTLPREDQPGMAELPPIGVPGQMALLHFTVANYTPNAKTEEPDFEVTTTITGDDGKPTLKEPPSRRYQRSPREDWKKLRIHVAQYPITFNRPGKFKVTVKVTDKVADKSAEYTLDLTVIDVK